MDDGNGIETNEFEPVIAKQSTNSTRNKGECSPPAKTDTTSVNIVIPQASIGKCPFARTRLRK